MPTKIEKGKTYTYEEIKEIYKKAAATTIADPMDEENVTNVEIKEKIKDPDMKFIMMLQGMILCNTLENNLFEQEAKENG